MTYFSPYSYIGSGVAANNLSDSVNDYVRFSQAEADSYSILQCAWTFTHVNRKADLRLIGNQDQASLETLQPFFFNYKNPEFLERGKTRSVLIPTIGKKLDFTFWLQPGIAPIVYLIPGFGAHHLSGNELALAELLVSNRFSVVTVSSTFAPSQLTLFPDGGHLGNLSQPAVQQAILRALDGLGLPQAKPAKHADQGSNDRGKI